MKSCIRMVALALFVPALTLMAGPTSPPTPAHPAPPAPPALQTRPVDPKTVLQQPDKPLDNRIDAGKVTQSDPPALPERVTLPMPPIKRIAQQAQQVPINADHFRSANDAIARGLEFLKTQQSETGVWLKGYGAAPTDSPEKVSPVSMAVTAMALKAFVQARPQSVNEDFFPKAVNSIVRAQGKDGSFDAGSMSNYVTATAVMALAAIDSHDFHDQIADGTRWLQTAQWDQSEGLAPSQDWFGGAGYGEHSRPDLSNTQAMLDALYDAGLSPDEPAFQRAIAFIGRTQNLKSANPSSWAGNDGGFVYTPANGGESMASEAAGEGRKGEKLPADQPRSLRSYGSMTYAGFKSMLYAGLSPDDVRVRAAFDWIRRHWTFDENSGLGAQGLYYYYHTMARTLLVAQQSTIADIDGKPHNWREELIDAVVKRQNADGSWKNQASRWIEGEPVMATIDALLAVEEAIKPVTD